MTKKIDIAALAAQAAAQTNMQEAQKGGSYTPPAAGVARARFIGYIELGKHRDEYQGKVSFKEKVQLIFELSGPKHEPKELEDGTVVPHRITITETLSLNEKANFFKLFNKMRGDRADIKHMSQMLGEGFVVKVVHKPGKADPTKVFAQLRELTGEYTVRPPYREDEDGNTVKVKVAPAISELRLFIWSLASKEMWDSLFIDGEYPADGDRPAKSKNVIQNKIREATNWDESPIASILDGADDLGDDDQDDEGDEPETKTPPKETKKDTAKGKKTKKEEAAPPPATADDGDFSDLDDDIPF